MKAAGGLVESSDLCDISPMVSYSGEGLQCLVEGKRMNEHVLRVLSGSENVIVK